MSLPTLRNDIARIYEPKAPSPSVRLATLRAAQEAGLHVYVAVAPTYPECDENDLRTTLTAIAELNPITVFHEPINIHAENVARIAEEAKARGVQLQTDVFATRESWQRYALGALKSVQLIAREVGLQKQLHLWPDKTLGSSRIVNSMLRPAEYRKWLFRWWSRIGEWPS